MYISRSSEDKFWLSFTQIRIEEAGGLVQKSETARALGLNRQPSSFVMIASRSSRPLRRLVRGVPRPAELGNARLSSLGSQQYSSSIFPIPLEHRLLEGQVAVITGGASGIGAATARLFTRHGARVFIADVQDSLGEETAKQCGRQAEFVHCDVRKEEDIVTTWERAFSLDNKLDIVFNNAGIAVPQGPIDEQDMANFDSVMELNLRAVVVGVKHAARLMKPAGKGSILCTASTAGVVGGIGPLPYTISKSGIVALVKQAAADLRDHGIRVNAVSPATILTPMVWSYKRTTLKEQGTEMTHEMEETIRKTAGFTLNSRSLVVEDIANAALYLSSDLGAMVSGHNLLVDLGSTTSKEVYHT